MDNHILTAEGLPARPELEQQLKRLDDSLGLRWIGPMNAWAVTFRWPEADKRRDWVRKGEYDADQAFDVLAYLPKDCPVDQAANYVQHHCQRWARDMGREDVARLLDHIHEHNAKQGIENAKSTTEYAEEMFEMNKKGIGEDLGIKIVKPVYQNEGSILGKRSKKVPKSEPLNK